MKGVLQYAQLVAEGSFGLPQALQTFVSVIIVVYITRLIKVCLVWYEINV